MTAATSTRMLLFLAASVFAPTVASARELPRPPASVTGTAQVLDGDTLRIANTTVRLHGIDAPEVAQTCVRKGGGRWPCGEAALKWLEQATKGKSVTCRKAGDGVDKYGRMLGVCTVAGVDLNAELVRRGLAWAFRKYSLDYAVLEDQVRPTGSGVWQVPATQAPWDYRTNAWEEALRTSPPGRPIKGNFKRRGGCIYHTPWSRHWRRVKIDEARGDRWFADEAEALAAGCRPPHPR